MTCTNILLIGNFLYQATGIKSVCEELADHLHLSPEWSVITTSSHPGRIRRFSDIIFTILKHHSEFNVANIEVYSGLAFIWAEAAARLLLMLRKPFILTLHGGGLPLLAQQAPKRVRRLLSIANAVTTPSHHIQQAFHPIRSDILYLPNGLDTQHYSFHLRSTPKANIVWLRAFHEIYNPKMAILALSSIVKAIPEAHLTMIGPDTGDGTFEQVKNLIRKADLGKSVTFTGAIPKTEVPTWLQKFDVFINTTRFESFGVSVLEAAALGLPIVTTDVGELPLLWSNGVNALLVPPDDSEAMSQAVQKILLDPVFAGKLSQNARQKAEQFDWKKILPMWERLIMQVLDDA